MFEVVSLSDLIYHFGFTKRVLRNMEIKNCLEWKETLPWENCVRRLVKTERREWLPTSFKKSYFSTHSNSLQKSFNYLHLKMYSFPWWEGNYFGSCTCLLHCCEDKNSEYQVEYEWKTAWSGKKCLRLGRFTFLMVLKGASFGLFVQ